MLNKLTVIGRLSRDPEMKYMPSGDPVTEMNVAVNRRWKDKTTGEMKEETLWVTVSAWGKLGENCNQFLSKGKKLYAEGRLSVEAYINQAGEAVGKAVLRAENVVFLSDAGEAS
jgi:single-strand DNA-binding protein